MEKRKVEHQVRMCLAIVAVLIAACLTTAIPSNAGGVPPDQPFASFWFPNELLSWSPQLDRDAPFNRAAVPLRNRFENPATQVNDHARPNEAQVTAISIMNPSTSNNPSQGYLDFDVFAFNYWQYVDLLIFWGGSAGEGLILAPNPGVTDAGHRHGVPVLGTIFFPPNAFGGDIQWVRDFVQRSGDTFPVADKLIEVAEYYGFDGWFINQETNGGDTQLATDIRDLIRYMHDNSDLHVQWYDAMIETGPVIWQNALTAQNDAFFRENGVSVADSMFLNFNWNATRLINSSTLAQNLGRSPYDLYAGVDVQANGYFTPVSWGALFPEGQPHRVSLGFFAPNWTYTSASSPQQFYEQANRFWVGANRDPSDTTTPEAWKGAAHYIPARSSVDDLPWVTHFNPGQGNLFAVEGEVLSTQEWNNRSLQDLMPTWRWLMTAEAGMALLPELDFSQAFYGGASLRVSGDLDGANLLQLYKSRLALTGNSVAQVAFKTGAVGASNLQLALAFEDGLGVSDFELLPVGAAASADWNVVEVDLSSFAGQTVASLGLGFEAAAPASGYEIHVGRLAIFDGAQDIPAPASALIVDTKDEIDSQTASLRLLWQHSDDTVYTYNVYQRLQDGTRIHLGGTPSDALFIAEVNRDNGEEASQIEVEAVGEEMGHSIPAGASFFWDDTGILFADGFETGNTSRWSNGS